MDTQRSATVKIINTDEHSFLDFGRLHTSFINSDDTTKRHSTLRPPSGKTSRFATIANADVVNIKRIHDQFLLNETAATDTNQLPKFVGMDLARTLNKVLLNLNLRIGLNGEDPGAKAWNPESRNVSELQTMIKLQNDMLTELGKNLAHFSKYNQELVQYNQKLIKERDVAVQSRHDLHQLLLSEREAKKKPARPQTVANALCNDPSHKDRKFFDDISILDAAFEEFKKRNKTDKDNTVQEPQISSFGVVSQNEKISFVPFVSSKETIRFAADLQGVEHQYEPPSTLSVGFKVDEKNDEKMKNNPFKDVCHGLPTGIKVTSYHPPKFQEFINQLSSYISLLSTNDIKRNRELMEASSMEEYLLLIQKRTDEITKSFHECIQILAEEQRIARQWRLKNQRLEKRIEKLVQKIEELQTLNENGTRIQVAFPNVNENADIVKTVKYKAKNFPSLDESKSFKEDCIKLVVVPTLKRAVGLP